MSTTCRLGIDGQESRPDLHNSWSAWPKTISTYGTNKKGNFEPVEYFTLSNDGVCVIIQIRIGPLGKAVFRCSLYMPILCYNCHYLMYILYVMI